MGMDADGFPCFSMLSSVCSSPPSPSFSSSRKATSAKNWEEKHSGRENLRLTTTSFSPDASQGHHGSGCRMIQKTVCHMSASDDLQPPDFFWQPLSIFSLTCYAVPQAHINTFTGLPQKTSHLGNNLNCLLVPGGISSSFCKPPWWGLSQERRRTTLRAPVDVAGDVKVPSHLLISCHCHVLQDVLA